MWNYPTKQRKTTRTNRNKQEGKSLCFRAFPFLLCRCATWCFITLLFFFWAFHKNITRATHLLPCKTDTLHFFAGEDALFIFLAFSQHTRRRKACYKVLSWQRRSALYDCATANFFTSVFTRAGNFIVARSFIAAWLLLLDHARTKSYSPTRCFKVRLYAEDRNHRCNDFIQIARIPGLTARTAFAAPSATSINGSYCFVLEVGWQSSVILFMMALIWLSGSLTMFVVRCIAICWCEYPCRWHLLPILVSIPCGWGFITHPLSHVKQLQMSNTRKYWLLTPFMQVVSASRARA